MGELNTQIDRLPHAPYFGTNQLKFGIAGVSDAPQNLSVLLGDENGARQAKPLQQEARSARLTTYLVISCYLSSTTPAVSFLATPSITTPNLDPPDAAIHTV